MQYPFSIYNYRGKKVGNSVQKYGPIDSKALDAGTALQDALMMCLYDPSAKLAMATRLKGLAGNTASLVSNATSSVIALT